MTTPLERMYPNRCYDCLTVITPDKVLCPQCEADYANVRRRGAYRNDREGG